MHACSCGRCYDIRCKTGPVLSECFSDRQCLAVAMTLNVFACLLLWALLQHLLQDGAGAE
jgi:hypothetical protein